MCFCSDGENKKAKGLEDTQQSICSSKKKFRSSSSFLRNLWWIYITIKKGCVYNIVFSSPYFFRSFIDSVNQQLLRIYPVPANLQSAHPLLPILFVTSTVISRYSCEQKASWMKQSFHQNILFPFCLCSVFCSLPAALLPQYVFTYFFSSPGFHFYIFI